MTKPYTRSHSLRWPLPTVSTVTVSTVTIGLMRKLRAEFNMDSDNEPEKDVHGFKVAVFKAHTGLDDQQRGALAQPDLNSIDKIISDLVLMPTYDLVKEKKAPNPDTFKLLVPVVDPMQGSEHITELTMLPPTVRLTDSVRELNGFARERQLVAECTKLMPEVVDKLHMPDWIATQMRLSDFLDETADYFPPQTLSD